MQYHRDMPILLQIRIFAGSGVAERSIRVALDVLRVFKSTRLGAVLSATGVQS